MYTFSGPISFLGFSSFCPCIFAQGVNASLGCSVLPVQYYYRFYVVTKWVFWEFLNTSLKNIANFFPFFHFFRNQTPTVLQTFGYFCLSISLTFVYAFNGVNIFCLGEWNPEGVDYSRYWYEEVPMPRLIVGSVVSSFGHFWTIDFFTFSYPSLLAQRALRNSSNLRNRPGYRLLLYCPFTCLFDNQSTE